ncbi:hypothetical protein Ddye_019512 [Dipteronia dyeriana]|uniref:Apple domain-containing protein n=1 Tax=Dipteronia dyeriana TaxID=168575 RepID=A0AAD9TY70_9ROSI|nr:hypothetical protein Ddye_019512 [Dipteronia dyeriana]
MNGLPDLATHKADQIELVNLTFVPRDFCDEYARCGANAICNEDTLVPCGCLLGFEPSYPLDWYLKCLETRKKKKTDECGKGDGEGFVRLEAVKLPDARNFTIYGNMNLKECEREWLKSCNCTGYAILDVHEGGQGCIAWYGELTDMRYYKDGQHFYLRVDAVELAANARKNSKHFLSTKTVLAFIVVPEVIPLIACIYYCWRRHAKRKGQKKKQQHRQLLLLNSATSCFSYRDSSNAKSIADESGNIEITFFELNTVIAATENFSSAKMLGRGGFGPVFKVIFLHFGVWTNVLSPARKITEEIYMKVMTKVMTSRTFMLLSVISHIVNE